MLQFGQHKLIYEFAARKKIQTFIHLIHIIRGASLCTFVSPKIGPFVIGVPASVWTLYKWCMHVGFLYLPEESKTHGGGQKLKKS